MASSSKSSGPSRPSSSTTSKRAQAPPPSSPPPSSPSFVNDDGGDLSDEEEEGDDDELPELDDSEEDEFEEDRLRTKGVAMWEDDQGEEEGSSAQDGSEQEEEEDSPRLSSKAKGKGREQEMARIQEEMRSLPISAILKAKRSLARTAQGPPTADEEDDLERSDRIAAAREKLAEMMRKKRGEGGSGGKEAEKEEVNGWKAGRQERERREKVKRADKHAPSEVTSKKPVSRMRTVVEVEKIERRDPRFSSLSGTMDTSLAARSYGFLSDLVANEYKDGQQALKDAQKALRNAPRALREEREADVEQAERTLSALRTKKELDERTRREREALQKWKKDEKKKQGEGKGQWHLKDSEKKRLLVEAKHAALLERGGQFAVKKALEKKRKKDAGKEKKARPRGLGFGPGAPSFDGAAPARKRVKM